MAYESPDFLSAPPAPVAPVVPWAGPEPSAGRSAGWLERLVERLPAWAGPAAVTAGIASAVVVTLSIHPTVGPSNCLVRMLTGFDCPGCGGTRAAWYLLHGDLPAAARHNAPFVFAVPFLLYLYVTWSLRTVFGWQVPRLRISSTALLLYIGGWFAFSVLRNLPWAPFSWWYV